MSYILRNRLNRPIHSIGLLVGGEKKVSTLTTYEKSLVEKGYITATEVKSETRKKATSKNEEVKNNKEV